VTFHFLRRRTDLSAKDTCCNFS